MKLSLKIVALIALLCMVSACRRWHTETSGGGDAKTVPAYDPKYVNTDPNLPGDRRP